MRLRLNIMHAGVGGIILVIAAVAWAQAASKELPAPASLVRTCGGCHQMEKQVALWTEGSHKDVPCTACHAETGLSGWAQEQFDQFTMKMVARAQRRYGEEPGAVTARVPNERCLNCHARQMPFVMQDITPPRMEPIGSANEGGPARVEADRRNLNPMPAIAGHDLHLTGAPQVKCTDCHKQTSHGAPPGQQEHRDQFHDLCVNCHDQKQLTYQVNSSASCAACHSDPMQVAPASHRGNWRNEHGKARKAEMRSASPTPVSILETDGGTGPVGGGTAPTDATQTCGDCHLAGSAGPHGSKLTQPAAFTSTKGSDACAACHQVPMPHPQDWLKQHDVRFMSDAGTCAQCHGTRDQGFHATFTGNPRSLITNPSSACQSCHKVEMPHKQGFLSLHGSEALRLGKETCTFCHSSRNPASPKGSHARDDFCTSCHAGTEMPHPDGYVSRHGQAALSAGQQACEACHSRANPVSRNAKYAAPEFCVKCHAGTAMPHPETFLSVHGKSAAQAGATCNACHSPANIAQPDAKHASSDFCADCHLSYRHAAGWVGRHGSQVTAACYTCHSGLLNTCANCHKPDKKWHPELWFIKHAKAVPAEGEASCAKCHAYVQPSCSTCHRNR